MKLTLENNKTVNIPDEEIKQLKDALGISTKEAVEVWLDDNGYAENEEQNALDNKAKSVKANFVDARTVTEKKERKPVTKKVSDEKKILFDSLVQNLDRCELVERENVVILNKNKLIQVKIGEKVFKIDLIECRPPKKKAD
jgi:predicted glutamine amidotransferase